VNRRIGLVVALVVVSTVALAGAWIALGGPSAGRATPVVPRFVEQALAAGVTHAYSGGFDYFVGGGVAAFDCNADELPELYFAGGTAPAALFVNRSQPGRALSFERRASAVTDVTSVTGAYPIDIDSDGLSDLVVLRRGANRILRGSGDCSFEDATAQWSFAPGDAWSTAFSARWDAGAEWPTLAVGNYLANSDPNALACADNQLYRPSSDGVGFADPLPLSPGWCSLSMLFSDWDRTGRRDLRVSNDRHYYGADSEGEEQLWNIPVAGDPRLYEPQDGWQTVRIWGMGIASSDVTGDGMPDYYLTSQGDNKLQVLVDGTSQPNYEDMALELGATAHRPYEGDTTKPSTAWHAEFQDVNNDTQIDLFVSKGNVEAMPEYAAQDPNNLLIGQPDGSFVEGASAAGLVDFARARGAALTDLNLDGMLDLVVVNRIENVAIYRNVGSGTAEEPRQLGKWLQVRPLQQTGNRDAIGAWVEVRTAQSTQLREVTVGGGHVSGQLGALHFGLGAADTAEVRVTWPDGEVGPWQSAAAGQRLVVERNATHAAPQ
jgi:hypothetical protein